jgi:hypothetical protein
LAATAIANIIFGGLRRDYHKIASSRTAVGESIEKRRFANVGHTCEKEYLVQREEKRKRKKCTDDSNLQVIAWTSQDRLLLDYCFLWWHPFLNEAGDRGGKRASLVVVWVEVEKELLSGAAHCRSEDKIYHRT